MKMMIAGGTGLIGQALARHAVAIGHEVVILSRGTGVDAVGHVVTWNGQHADAWVDELSNADVVVNLCGASIGEGRWTQRRKAQIKNSRLIPAKTLVSAMQALPHRPKYVQASAIGYYGIGDEPVDEHAPAGTDYLADLALAWEAEANAYSGPVYLPRFGVVLAAEGGALPKLALPFKLFVGGRLGNGNQWVSWVTLEDTVNALMFALQHELDGAFNVTAPNPVTNQNLSYAVGATLKRPALLPTPGLALKMLLGEQAALLLEGQRVLPRRLTDAGFTFAHPDIDTALLAILS